MDVIRDNMQVQWDENAEAIRNSPYFKHLNETELNKCKTISFIKTFKKNEYVFGEHGVFVNRSMIAHKLGDLMKKITLG